MLQNLSWHTKEQCLLGSRSTTNCPIKRKQILQRKHSGLRQPFNLLKNLRWSILTQSPPLWHAFLTARVSLRNIKLHIPLPNCLKNANGGILHTAKANISTMDWINYVFRCKQEYATSWKPWLEPYHKNCITSTGIQKQRWAQGYDR